MFRWMDGWIDQQMFGRDGQMFGWARWTDGWLDGQTEVQLDERTGMNVWKHGWIEGQMGDWEDRSMVEQTSRQMDR